MRTTVCSPTPSRTTTSSLSRSTPVSAPLRILYASRPRVVRAETQRKLDELELQDLMAQEKKQTQAALDAFRFMQKDLTPIRTAPLAAQVPPFMPAPILPLASQGMPVAPSLANLPSNSAATPPARSEFKTAITPSLEQQQNRPLPALQFTAPKAPTAENLVRVSRARHFYRCQR